MDEVAENGEEIIITKNGKPVAKLVACRKEGILEFGRHHERIRILGDIVAPMPAEWFDSRGDEATGS